MSKDNSSSIAPKERINIKYVSATGGQTSEIELPLNLLVVGDMKGAREDTPIEERKIISVNKNNFSSVMNEAGIHLNFMVPNRLQENNSEEALNINLPIKSLNDFTPDRIAQNIPELKKLLELREALVALKGPLGNIPSFRARLQELLSDEAVRAQLLQELELLDEK